jgi:hypothetical protein
MEQCGTGAGAKHAAEDAKLAHWQEGAERQQELRRAASIPQSLA